MCCAYSGRALPWLSKVGRKHRNRGGIDPSAKRKNLDTVIQWVCVYHDMISWFVCVCVGEDIPYNVNALHSVLVTGVEPYVCVSPISTRYCTDTHDAFLTKQSTPPTGEDTKTKGKGKGKGRAKAQANGTPAATPKATTKRRSGRRRSADTNANMSDSYSDNSDGGAGDSPCRTPIRRRPRSTRHQTRTSAEWYAHPLPPPTTLEQPLVIDSDDDDVRGRWRGFGAAFPQLVCFAHD